MKIATTTGDFLEYAKKGDICSALTMMADSGVKHVDINFSDLLYPESPLCGDGWEQWADEIANTGARLGLDFVQAHSSDSCYVKGEDREYREQIIRRELAVCQKLGILGMVVHGISTPGGDREDFMVKNTEFYKEMLVTAEQTNVIIYTENTCHSNAPQYHIFTGSDGNELCERVNHPLFGICWDVGHANAEGVDQYKEVVTMGKNLKALHVHDNNFKIDLHLAPYCGNACYDALLKGLVDVGYKGYFTLEAFCAPVASGFCFCNRKPYELDGVRYDKLLMPPLELKIRGEQLMIDTAKFMLEAYDCYEE